MPPKLSLSAAASTAVTLAESAVLGGAGALPPISALARFPPLTSNESNTLGYDSRRSVARKLSTTYDTISILLVKEIAIQRFHVSKSTAIKVTNTINPTKSRRKARVFCKGERGGVCSEGVVYGIRTADGMMCSKKANRGLTGTDPRHNTSEHYRSIYKYYTS